MACDRIAYNGEIYSLSDFKQYVESNPDEFKSYFAPQFFDAELDYKLDIVDALQSDKVREPKGNLQAFINDLKKQGVKDQQIVLINPYWKKDVTKDDIITSLLADMTYTVEINTAIQRTKIFEDQTIFDDDYLDEVDKPTRHYSSMIVPGGTNYTENEIRTPDITPSIKGHAAFATDKGIGWFRSDDKTEGGKLRPKDHPILGEQDIIKDESFGGIHTKTRRILEVQSDLFQKGRNDLLLTITNKELIPTSEFLPVEDMAQVSNYEGKEKIIKSSENQFLQLLNKDNNWVTFFVKSIIQDSAKKGYEKVLFPVGDTAAKVEGHQTLSDFIRGREEMIYQVDLAIDNLLKMAIPADPGDASEYQSELTSMKREKVQYEKELEDAKEGRNKFSAINAFYETTIFNILKKQGYNPERITDEYGNGWYQVSPTPEVILLDASLDDIENDIKNSYKPFQLFRMADGTVVLDSKSLYSQGYKIADKIKTKYGWDSLVGLISFDKRKSSTGTNLTVLNINKQELSNRINPQPELFDATLDDLAEGLKKAAINQTKFENQLNRLVEESTKVKKKINAIENETVRTRLRDSLRLIQDPEKQKDLKNFVYFVFEAAETLKFYSEKLKKLQNLPIDEKIGELDRIKTLADNFQDLIEFLNKDFRFLEDTNEFKKLAKDLDGYYGDIKHFYEAEAEQLAVESLAQDLTEDQRIALKSLQKDLDNLTKQLEKAKAAEASEKFTKAIEAKIEQTKKHIMQFVPDDVLLSDTFKGLRGDLGWVTANLRSVLAMGDPILSTFGRKLKRGLDKVRRALIPLKNLAQDVIERYERALGVNRLMPMSKYYEGLYQIEEIATVNDNGEIEKEKYYSLLSPFKEGFYNDKLTYETKIKNLKAQGASQAELDAAEKDYLNWLSKYAERKYKDEWYERYNLLTPAAAKARGFILDDMNNILRGPNRDSLTEADVEKLHELKYQLKRLSSLRKDNGELKEGEALEIAKSIQAFNKKTAEMSYWETTEENKNWFNIILEKKKEQVANGLISQADFDRWFATNTQRVISQEFYKERQVLIDTIQSIMNKLPKEQFKEDIKKLWDNIIDVSRPYRDEDNILDGTEFNKPEVSKVYENEEAIETLKKKLIRFSGLTIDEENELNGLWGALDSLTPDEIERFMELRDQKSSYKAYIQKYVSDIEFQLLMTSFQKLAEISKWQPTQYYLNVYQQKLHEYRAKTDPAFLKRLELVEDEFKANDEWYKNNHITKTKKKVDDSGHVYVVDEEEPLYIWKDIIPTNEAWVEQDAPGFGFKTRIVKDEFINPNHKTDVKDRIMPKKFIVEDGQSKISPYVNENYEGLRNNLTDSKDAARWEMLQFLTRTHFDAQAKLPAFKRLGNFLPGVVKTAYDRTLDRGVKGTLKAGKQLFQKTQTDVDTVLGDVSQIELSVIPVKFSTKVEPDDQSLNLADIILRHRAGAEEYEFLESQLGEANIIQSALRTAQKDIPQSRINQVLQNLGFSKFIKADKESRRSKIFNEFVRMMFYGETEAAFPTLIGGINTNKLINNVLGISSGQIMTYNIPAHITNLLSGEIQNIIESVGGKYFTFKDYLKAKSIYMANVHNFWNDYTKEGNKSFWSALADKLDVPQGDFMNHLGQKTEFSRLKHLKSHIMIIKNVGEHEMQISTMIAMAHNMKVEMNGEMVPLYQALELKNGKIEIKGGAVLTEEDLAKFEDRVHNVVRALNGAYSKIDRSMAEKTVLGKLAYYMRKYFMPMAFRRFETFKYDYEEQDFKEGYYTTAWHVIKDLARLNLDLVKNWSTYAGTLTAEEKRNLRRFAAEATTIAALTLLILAMGGYDKDRELQGRWLHTMALYQVMKMKSEAETFLPGPGFNELSTLFSSPFAAATTFKTSVRILNDLTSWAVGSPRARFQRDYGIWSEGDLRLKADMLKLMGFNGNVVTPENLVKNFELRNR